MSNLKLELCFTSEEQLFRMHEQANVIKGFVIGALAKTNNNIEYEKMFDCFEFLFVQGINGMMQAYDVRNQIDKTSK